MDRDFELPADRHEVYLDLFADAFSRSRALEGYCLAGFNVPPGGTRIRRFFRLVFALRSAIRWCEKNRFLGQTFIIREFSTWALLLILPAALRTREWVGYNINHNLVGRASYLAVAQLSRVLKIYYFSGSAGRASGIPEHVRLLDVSSAYPPEFAPKTDGPCVVILPRRADQHQAVPTDKLRSTIQASTHNVRWIGADPYEEPLSHREYQDLIVTARCIVLAYHQGRTDLRHSGVIWDGILAGTLVFVPATKSFLHQAGPALGRGVQAYANAEELERKLRVSLS